MLFNSLEYALFLPTVVLVYWVLPRRPRGARRGFLLAASYVFYASWDYRFLSLILVSTVVDYTLGRVMERTEDQRRRRWLLAVSFVVNLGILGFFKYFDFFVDSAAGLLDRVGLEANEPVLRIILPVGISFYTFQTIAYTFDVYRRRVPACRNLLLFATFVGYFPQLVAGPIERAHHLLPQLAADRRPPGIDRLQSGLGLILLGLVKKVVIADTIAPVVDRLFDDPARFSSASLVFGLFAFAFQLYGDFSGYTDIARGSSRLLSVELVRNFRQPYLAPDPTNFWRRWHISLTDWFRDYVYIPLGGNRGGPARTNINLMVTFLAVGLWHGAGWNFVIWGGMHGLALVAHRLWRPGAPVAPALPRSAGQAAGAFATTAWFALSMAFFRSPTPSAAWEYLSSMFSGGGAHLPWPDVVLVLLLMVLLLVLDYLRIRTVTEVLERRPVLVGTLAGASVTALVVFSGTTTTPFIYFQF